MNNLQIKKWFLTDFTISVKDTTWSPLDLSAYDWIDFIMVSSAGTIKTNSPWTFVDKPNWKITYNFVSNDVNTVGTFSAYFSLKKAWVKKLSVPTTDFQIEIVKDFL